jgi:hypothetical protein
MHHELLFALYLLSWNLNNLQKQLLLQTKADLKSHNDKRFIANLSNKFSFIISDDTHNVVFLVWNRIKILEVI